MATVSIERYGVLTLILTAVALGVDRNNFKTCDQSSFCKRNRALEPGDSSFVIRPDSVEKNQYQLTFDLLNEETQVEFSAEVNPIKGDIVRLRIKEKDPKRERYQVKDALAGDPEKEKWKIIKQKDNLKAIHGNCTTYVVFKPFRMDVLVAGNLAVSVNSRGLLNFEHYRERERRLKEYPPEDEEEEELPDPIEENPTDQEDEEFDDEDDEDVDIIEMEGESDELEEVLIEDDGEFGHKRKRRQEREPEYEYVNEEPGMWDEDFKSHHDSKPYGPSSVGVDVSFPGVNHVYGIPEHADSLALKSTRGGGVASDPYRLYNLDVFEYELNNPMALYGSIPYLLAHSPTHTVGMFWHNAAETWIDISTSRASEGLLGQLVSYFQSSDDTPITDTHWFSESGIIDVFFMLGPRPYDLFRQYSSLTGTTYLPPLFSIGYHQSRWNYNDEEDVKSVNDGFDTHDIPMDVIWLDIEHTDGKKYFTWDATRFPDSRSMIDHVASFGRKMVTIIDPHIKRESGYWVHEDATSRRVYVRNSGEQDDYEGWCWPGSSSWVDFINPENREWWADLFDLERYDGSTLDLYTWNDMNEPSVFNGPEVSMHKDAKHFGGWEHRDVHNVYGMLQPQATAEGQMKRSGGKLRPFVLSRAFFAGMQRFGAIWTGDNSAEWDHLAMSFPMVMSIGIAGLPFAGADVGGFFKNPDSELLVRWYEGGAFYPFFRAHAHVDTKRREPWLFDEDTLGHIRRAVRRRYELLPLFYTLFYQSSLDGSPIMRPLWVEFPKDVNTFAMDDQFMIGDSLLVKPVTKPGVSSTIVYLPGPSMVWYNVESHSVHNGNTRIDVPAPLGSIPLFQRGGSIIPKKLRIRRASSLMLNDPYTLSVALDNKGKATGYLYSDDGSTFSYRYGKFVYRKFSFEGVTLKSSSANSKGVAYPSKEWVEKVVIIGVSKEYKHAKVQCSSREETVAVTYNAATKTAVVRKPRCFIKENFTISLTN